MALFLSLPISASVAIFRLPPIEQCTRDELKPTHTMLFVCLYVLWIVTISKHYSVFCIFQSQKKISFFKRFQHFQHFNRLLKNQLHLKSVPITMQIQNVTHIFIARWNLMDWLAFVCLAIDLMLYIRKNQFKQNCKSLFIEILFWQTISRLIGNKSWLRGLKAWLQIDMVCITDNLRIHRICQNFNTD